MKENVWGDATWGELLWGGALSLPALGPAELVVLGSLLILTGALLSQRWTGGGR